MTRIAMKFLALSDRVSPLVYTGNAADRYADVDIVFGCGDLPFYYLEFIATVLKAPVLVVYGNHDVGQLSAGGSIVTRAEGCEQIDGRVIMREGLLIAGLGGSPRYNDETPHQYSEFEMALRIMAMVPRLLLNRLRYGRWLDILVTHSPMAGVHDGSDVAHRGFKTLRAFIQLFKPELMLHGHLHLWRSDIRQETQVGPTMVINVYPVRLIEWPLKR